MKLGLPRFTTLFAQLEIGLTYWIMGSTCLRVKKMGTVRELRYRVRISKDLRVNVFYSYPIGVTTDYHFFAQSGSGLTRISVRGVTYWIMRSTGLRVNVFLQLPNWYYRGLPLF